MGTRERRGRSYSADAHLASLFGEALLLLPIVPSRDSLALAAVGGYGRGELSPGSDLDLLFLHNGNIPEADLTKAVEKILYPLWDSGYSVDHSVRTRSEVKEIADTDGRVALGLLDIRWVAGNRDLVDTVESVALMDWRKNGARWINELRKYSQERSQRSGELAYLLEPDLKESRGGLRDITALRGIAKTDLVAVELDRIAKAESTLNNAREALHSITGKSSDRLSFFEQDKVAELLGYKDADELMLNIAQSARTVDYLSETVFHRFDQYRPVAKLFSFKGRGSNDEKVTEIAKGVGIYRGEVVITGDLETDPLILLRAAASAAQRGIPLSIDSCKLAKEKLNSFPEPWPREAREDFVALLGAGNAMAQVWEALDQAELTQILIPEWNRIRSLPQRNALHRHTVDRHMVETALHASLLTRQVHRPDLLLVSALLHDMGKGLPGDHSIIGAEIIKPILQRMGFPENDVSVVETLVMHHLLLSTVATRRDLDDPTTINSVCELISDPLTIELLHALSISDGQATGNTAWSNWKASLVADLVNRVKKQISGVGLPPQPEFSESEKDLAKSGEVHLSLIKRDEITELLIIAPDRPGLLSIVAGFLTISRLNVRSASTRTFANSAVMRWFVLPDVYAPDISESALKQSLVQTLNGEVDIAAKINERVSSYRSASPIPVPPPIVEVIHDGATEATVLDVRSHDQMGLLYLLGKAVTEAGVDVRAAIVSTLGAEACDSLYITEVDGRPLDPKRALEVAQSIEQQLRANKI